MAAPKQRPPSREQVQLEVDAIMRDVEEKRTKRSKQQQQLHDDMLSAIFKSVFEDTVPDSAVGIYSSGEKEPHGMHCPQRSLMQKATACQMPRLRNMYPAVRDQEHREWINSIMHSPDGPPNAVDQLIYSAFECALSILRAAGSAVVSIGGINPYQLDLFLFKDMGIGGILSKFH